MYNQSFKANFSFYLPSDSMTISIKNYRFTRAGKMDAVAANAYYICKSYIPLINTAVALYNLPNTIRTRNSAMIKAQKIDTSFRLVHNIICLFPFAIGILFPLNLAATLMRLKNKVRVLNR